jgi:hypothetical protein
MVPMTTSDFSRLCANTEETSSLDVCVNQNCSVREVLGLYYLFCRWTNTLTPPVIKNMTETVCGQPQRDRSHAVSVTGIVGISLAMIAFVLRIVARKLHRQFGMDDWTIIIAMVFPSRTLLHGSLLKIGICDSAIRPICCP